MAKETPKDKPGKKPGSGDGKKLPPDNGGPKAGGVGPAWKEVDTKTS